jgi:succinate-semialdehyde dehydrogenase / glutarate-semialdehyde dehydrogenase
MRLLDRLQDRDLYRAAAFIGGRWLNGSAASTFDVVDPATGEVVGCPPDLDMQAVRQAIEVAQHAWPAWRAKTGKERATLLRRWHDLIVENCDDLAKIMTAEQGKPLAEARGEILFGASYVDWYAEEAKRVNGDVIPTHRADSRVLVLKQPIGVVAAITPWNFPSAMVARKCAPALAAGCTVVVKPAEQTPFSALALAELAHRAGIPDGVLNVVTTSRPEPAGIEITSNPLVRLVTFTGSTQVGKILMRRSADTVKKVTLELGGNAPFIVFDDADIEAAVDGAVASKFRTSGQTCVCANRIFVQNGIYDRFKEAFSEAVQRLVVGNGFDDGVLQGPLINEQALEKVERHVADARACGATVAAGGSRHRLGGTFFEPTVLGDVTTDMLVTREETFGPVAPLLRFSTEDEVVALANDTPYGLAGYFYARDLGRVWRVAEALECGSVGVNTGVMSTEIAPAGGFKESGIGREGARYGIEEFLELKYLCISGVGAAR